VAATTVHRAARADDERYDPEATVELAPLLLARTAEASRESRVVPWLMGVAVMVLLLACANVANLLLARSMRQRRETAVRLALGVSRSRLVGTVVTEGIVLALLGGAAAVAVAVWGGEVIRSVLVPGGEWESGVDVWRVAAFSVGLALVAGLFAGIVPAFRSSQSQTTEALKGSGRGVVRGRSGLRSTLLVAQAAICVVLLVGTSLFVLSLRAAKDVDLGFDPAPVLLVRLEPQGGYPGGEAMTALYREARESIRSAAGVEATALSTVTPFQNARSIGDELRVPGLDSLPRTRAGGAYIHAVTGGYFETLGLELLRGREIRDSDDTESAPRVAVVNETMAGLVWPDGDALGGCLIIQEEPCATVVGVVEDHNRFDLTEEESMHYYVPLTRAPHPWPPSRLMVRTAAPAALAPVIRRELGSVPGLRLVAAEPFRDVVDPSYRSWRLGATLFSAFGLLALLVASVGLYSVLAFDVAERRAEMGIRAALGATRNRLVGSVLVSGVRPAALGVLLGLAASAYGAWAARDLLFGTPPYAPAAFIPAAGAMLVVAAAASGIPAWRAAKVDPNEALRAD
jgi:predicted permease